RPCGGADRRLRRDPRQRSQQHSFAEPGLGSMTEVVAFPDVEAVMVAGLAGALESRGDSATVAPKFMDGRHVRVSRIGGTRWNIVTDRPMLLCECYDANETDASDLARLARALVWAMPGSEVSGAWVRRVVEVSGPQSYPDPDTRLPRYQLTVQVSLRGEAI